MLTFWTLNVAETSFFSRKTCKKKIRKIIVITELQ